MCWENYLTFEFVLCERRDAPIKYATVPCRQTHTNSGEWCQRGNFATLMYISTSNKICLKKSRLNVYIIEWNVCGCNIVMPWESSRATLEFSWINYAVLGMWMKISSVAAASLFSMLVAHIREHNECRENYAMCFFSLTFRTRNDLHLDLVTVSDERSIAFPPSVFSIENKNKVRDSSRVCVCVCERISLHSVRCTIVSNGKRGDYSKTKQKKSQRMRAKINEN